MASSGITSPTYDPITTATNLATKATAGNKAALTAQLAANTADSTALGKLKTAMSTFQTSLSAMATAKTVLSQSATFSNSTYGTATASASAAPGTYAFYVEKLATAAQTSYSGLQGSPSADGGTLSISLGSGVDSSFMIDLSAADKDGNGTITPQEIASAINSNTQNAGRVTAAVVTINGQAQLVLSSNKTGAANDISVDASDVGNADLKTALSTGTPVIVPQDASIYLGGQGGTQITQDTNTFTNIGGVSMTFTQAMAANAAPVTLTVGADQSGTTANVQGFVDAYNTLKGVLDELTKVGDPNTGVAAGIFAHDSGLAALKSNLNSSLRQTVGGVSLAQYGIIAARDGTLTLDSAKLNQKLASNPGALDTLLGNNSLSASSGVSGSLDKYLDVWTSATGGQITRRLDVDSKRADSLAYRQERLTAQYDNTYARYLTQFTQLQVLQEQMSKTVDMFDALFSSAS